MAKKTILFIEDESTLRKALEEFLTDEGFSVLLAPDGEKGIEIAVKEKPDLILLDIILPKKDGYQVLGELKKNKDTANIPTILLTNLEGPDNIQKAFEYGATTYLVKSDYKLEDVVRKIKETLKI